LLFISMLKFNYDCSDRFPGSSYIGIKIKLNTSVLYQTKRLLHIPVFALARACERSVSGAEIGAERASCGSKT